MKYLIYILLLGGASGAYGQSLHEDIKRQVSEQLFRFRAEHIPEIKPADRVKVVDGDTIRKTGLSVLLGDKIDPLAVLAMDIQPWPSVNPRPDYYMLTKTGNRFVIEADPLKSPEKFKKSIKDTVTYPQYDQYNKYFPDDDHILVYYQPADKHLIRLSGNINQDGIYASWFRGSSGLIAQVRMAQYNAGPSYNSLVVNDTAYYFFNKCGYVKGSPGHFIVRTLLPAIKDHWEIIYYSNKKEITGDKDKHHFYEVKIIRQFSVKGTSPEQNYQQKPLLKLIDKPEQDRLRKFYGKPIFIYGDIDMSAFD